MKGSNGSVAAAASSASADNPAGFPAGLKPHPVCKHSCVPLLEAGDIETLMRREVLPHAPDAWYVLDSVKTGCEVSFTRYFYKPQPLRTLEEIRTDILALEKETEGLLGEIVGSGR
jgi:hypothetical protein